MTAVNDLTSPDNLAYLLNYDSVHGGSRERVDESNGKLAVGGVEIPLYSEKDPANLPWKDLGIDLVFECTGVFRTSEGLQKHLDAGARWAILSAPAKDDQVSMVVHGVNQAEAEARMISCANCITPVVEVMDRRIGIKKALMTTVHADTSSQAIVDGPRNTWRRGGAVALSFVPTSTGAAKATAKVLPNLEGRFDGIAVRGPVPVGSLADMVFLTKRDTSVEEINDAFRSEAQDSRYAGILGSPKSRSFRRTSSMIRGHPSWT